MNPSIITIKLSKNGYEKVMRVRTRQIQRVHCQNAHIAKVKKILISKSEETSSRI